MTTSAFVIDIESIRDSARANMQQGAVTHDYPLDNHHVVEMLNSALATEIICALRYKQHYFMCEGMNVKSVANEFLEHATQEQQHVDTLASRITQLGGEPDMDPASISERAHANYVPASDIRSMIEENLVAERIAIDTYRAMVRYLGDSDPTTRRIIEDILAVEEEHADDLSSLLHRER